ncbi:cupin domain-containing protein [Massilia sp. CCM 8734]|uniref:cupin domain-containing protein n=1 Tax=Massilia sp. CCM 8734 TaxID=2609283 RepID=UPI00141E4D9F|nr:cupin domain-containing protein [Massilia sp. CCM 8734]NIA00118.1 cupin domain-containing protein [Massilia sp. CCM 8734]
MTALTPDGFMKEESWAEGSAEPNQTLWISEAGGLTQFGAFVEVLQPGTRSSIRHWHSAEDEMVYVLEGQLTLVEGDAETLLKPGDAATFRAGVAVGHFLWNRSASPTRCLVVGTRAAVDRITYPEHDRVCHRDRALPDDIWTNAAGEPASSPY